MLIQRHKSLGVWITEQDRALFHYLYANKVATVAQIHRDIYPDHAYGNTAKEAQRKLAEHDPIALRSVYARMFEAIFVGDEDREGNRRLDFVLRDGSSSTSTCRLEDVSSTCLEMVDPSG